MSTKTAVFSGLPTGLTLTAYLFTLADPNTVAYTSDSTLNRTNANDEYVFTFGEVAGISGDFTMKVKAGSVTHGTGKRTFAGIDGEVATVTPEGVVLDAATQTQVDNILDGVGWLLADATGAIAAPQSATATAVITAFGSTYTVQYAGLTSTGVRTAPTLSKA